MIHVMTDIETFSTSNNALILSLGGVKFDAETILDRFHVGVDPVDAERYGLDISAATVMWWFDPERDAARKAIFELPKVDLFAALDGFDIWVKQTPGDQLGSVWGNGATFDNVKIRNAYDKVGLTYPVHYTKDECYRTLKNRCPDVDFARVGTHHDALADAESQAIHLQKICKQFGIKL